LKGGEKLSLGRRAYKFVKYRILKLLYFRRERPTLNNIRGLNIVVLPNVFHPGLYTTSPHFADTINNLNIKENEKVLDLGTGSGIGAVFAAQYSKNVTATDINPHAVRCAKINALINGFQDRMTVKEGSMFDPVRGETFDIIFYTPPFYLGKPENWHERAFRGGDFEEHVCHTFLKDSPKHLSPEGRIYLLWSTIADYPGLEEEIIDNELEIVKVDDKDTLTEVINIYELKHHKA